MSVIYNTCPPFERGSNGQNCAYYTLKSLRSIPYRISRWLLISSHRDNDSWWTTLPISSYTLTADFVQVFGCNWSLPTFVLNSWCQQVRGNSSLQDQESYLPEISVNYNNGPSPIIASCRPMQQQRLQRPVQQPTYCRVGPQAHRAGTKVNGPVVFVSAQCHQLPLLWVAVRRLQQLTTDSLN